MKPTLAPGLTYRDRFTVTRQKTVPFLYPESELFANMPEVFATGFMVGLMEWCCIEAIGPHLEEGEGSLGTMIEVSHEAATPVGLSVTVDCTLEEVNGRGLVFSVLAHDGHDVIGRGRHGRSVVRWDRFLPKVAEKAQRAAAGEFP